MCPNVYLNYYATTGSLNDRVTPVIRKVFHGGNIVPNQFKFELYLVEEDEEGGETETYVETAYANEDGTIFFRAFDFTNEDADKSYSYRVYEIEDEREGEVVFDAEPINLKISIRDNGEGKLIAEVEKDREAFENYKVYALTIAKKVSGNADAEAEYWFTVKLTKDGATYEPEDGIPASWELQADGSYRFKLKDGESERVRVRRLLRLNEKWPGEYLAGPFDMKIMVQKIKKLHKAVDF